MKTVLSLVIVSLVLSSTSQAIISLNIYENDSSKTVFSYSGSLTASELDGYSVGLSSLRSADLLYSLSPGSDRNTRFFNFDFEFETRAVVNRLDLDLADLEVVGSSLFSALVSPYEHDPISIDSDSSAFGFLIFEDIDGTSTDFLQIYLPNVNDIDEIFGEAGVEGYTDVAGQAIYDFSFAELGFTVGDSLVMPHATNGNSIVEVHFVPEPRSSSLWLGIVVLCAIALRRRRNGL